MSFEPKLPRTDELDRLLDNAGVDMLDYDNRWKNDRLRVTQKDIEERSELFVQLVTMAHRHRMGN